MALLDAVKRMLGKGSDEPHADKVYIVDANSIEQDNQKQMSPHQQISVLKRLATFAKREGISMQALLDGKPLRVVADGGDFSGVKVFFTRDKMDTETLLRRRLKAVRADKITVISPSLQLEKDVETSGAQLMSTSTFRKALGVGGRRQKGPANPSRRKSGGSSRRGRRGGSSPRNGGQQRGAPKKSESEHVSDLIDLVD